MTKEAYILLSYTLRESGKGTSAPGINVKTSLHPCLGVIYLLLLPASTFDTNLSAVLIYTYQGISLSMHDMDLNWVSDLDNTIYGSG